VLLVAGHLRHQPRQIGIAILPLRPHRGHADELACSSRLEVKQDGWRMAGRGPAARASPGSG